MPTFDMSKNERIITIFKSFMAKSHELPEQPTYYCWEDKGSVDSGRTEEQYS